MEKIRIIAETPPVSLSYLKNILNQMRRVYPHKVIYEFCLSIDQLKIEMASNEKIVFITHSDINPKFSPINFDGVGLDRENIAIVKYQKTSKRYCHCLNRKLIAGGMRNTLFLLLHEIGHLAGLDHCENPKCVMARIECNGKVDYCWRCLAGYKKIDTSVFCLRCKSFSRL